MVSDRTLGGEFSSPLLLLPTLPLEPALNLAPPCARRRRPRRPDLVVCLLHPLDPRHGASPLAVPSPGPSQLTSPTTSLSLSSPLGLAPLHHAPSTHPHTAPSRSPSSRPRPRCAPSSRSRASGPSASRRSSSSSACRASASSPGASSSRRPRGSALRRGAGGRAEARATEPGWAGLEGREAVDEVRAAALSSCSRWVSAMLTRAFRCRRLPSAPPSSTGQLEQRPWPSSPPLSTSHTDRPHRPRRAHPRRPRRALFPHASPHAHD